MVCKIHKNIKSSLRETIKGIDPPEHFKHHLELCPRSIRPPSPAYPPLLSLPSPFLCHMFFPPFLLSFPRLLNPVCVRLLICTPALSFCTCPTTGCLLSRRRCAATRGRSSSLWRCSEEKMRGRKEQPPL